MIYITEGFEMENQYRKLKHEFYEKLKDKDGMTIISDLMPTFRQPEYDDKWGDWIYQKNETLQLFCKLHKEDYSARNVYEIDIDRVKTNKEAMEWILRVSQKSWCNDKILANLVYALVDINNLWSLD